MAEEFRSSYFILQGGQAEINWRKALPFLPGDASLQQHCHLRRHLSRKGPEGLCWPRAQGHSRRGPKPQGVYSGHWNMSKQPEDRVINLPMGRGRVGRQQVRGPPRSSGGCRNLPSGPRFPYTGTHPRNPGALSARPTCHLHHSFLTMLLQTAEPF